MKNASKKDRDAVADWLNDTSGAFEKDCAQMVVRMDAFLTRNYGPRCDDYEPDCCVCKAWRLRDGFKAYACD